MAKSKPIKIGIVSLAEISPRHWQVRYRDPQSGRDVRRRLEGISKTEALQVAATVSTGALSHRGYLPGKQTPLPSIHEAIAEGIKLSKQRACTKKTSCRWATYFEEWIADRFKGVKTWDQVQPRMIQTYASEMEERGLAPDTVKNRLKPIKQAWRLMAENFPDRVRPLPRIRLATPKPTAIETLTPFEVSAYLDFLRVKDRYLHTFETVRFLCGLRILETAALRIQDVDFEAGTLTVTETPWHVPKTKSSYRTIPVPTEALVALKEWIDEREVVTLGGELFPTMKGRVWSPEGGSRRIKEGMKAASKALSLPRLSTVRPHCLRASCSSMAARLGCPDNLVQRFLGHSGRDILTRHYQAVDLSDLRTVSVRLDAWRSLVWKSESGNNLATREGDRLEVIEKTRLRVV